MQLLLRTSSNDYVLKIMFCAITDVLRYKLDQAGFLAAMPYMLMAAIVQSAGFLADLARTKGRLTTTQVPSTGDDNLLRS